MKRDVNGDGVFPPLDLLGCSSGLPMQKLKEVTWEQVNGSSKMRAVPGTKEKLKPI